MHAGALLAWMQLLNMGGGAVTVSSGLVCGTASVSPRLGGTAAVTARTGGTAAVEPRTGGAAGVREC